MNIKKPKSPATRIYSLLMLLAAECHECARTTTRSDCDSCEKLNTIYEQILNVSKTKKKP